MHFPHTSKNNLLFGPLTYGAKISKTTRSTSLVYELSGPFINTIIVKKTLKWPKYPYSVLLPHPATTASSSSSPLPPPLHPPPSQPQTHSPLLPLLLSHPHRALLSSNRANWGLAMIKERKFIPNWSSMVAVGRGRSGLRWQRRT